MAIDEIRAEPADAARDIPRGKPTVSEPVGLLLAAAQSRFTVTLEYCRLAGSTAVNNGPTRFASTQPGGKAASFPWPEPAVQRRGRGWIYEVFTPPSVLCGWHGRTLAAIPPEEAPPAEAGAKPCDLQLLQVRRGAFRLQLAGYAGERNDLHGIFVNTVTGETAIGRAGDHLARHRVRLKQLVLGRADTGAGRGAATGEPLATAVLVDEDTGDEVVLTTRGQALSGPPLGLFAGRKPPILRSQVKEGDSIEITGVHYRVERLELDPPLAVVACVIPDGGKETREILTPPAPPAPAETSPDALNATRRNIRPLPTKP